MTTVYRSRLARPVRRVVRSAGCDVLGIRSSLPPEDGKVALTFDDGPDATYTADLLDLLATLGVSATFFCVGRRVERHPELVARMVAEGHGVGSHSQSHDPPATLSLRARFADFRAGRQAIERAAGRRIRLFRPPQGYLAANAMPAIALAGLRPWLWTVDPEDWRPGIRPESIVASVSRTEPGGVIVLHDGLELPVAPEALDRSATLAALPTIVDRLRRRGLTFTTLPA
jgi:peptidoglycan/xylan/chitin deacetylase (PgdA/CDA1 family)